MENNYQLSRIHNYVNGLMSKEDMHALEREALEDPFLQDAIDGYKLQEGVDAKQLSLLQQRLAGRIEQHALGKQKRFYSWQRLAIGMAAGVMFVTVCTLLLIRYLPYNRSNSNLTEVEIMQEHMYSISVANTGTFDGEPIVGWQQLESYLNDHYTGESHEEGDLRIQFKIHADGTPYDYKIQNVHAEQSATGSSEIIDLITKHTKWTGTQAEILINLHRLNF